MADGRRRWTIMGKVKVRVGTSGIHGLGVFACQDIMPGQQIGIMTGDVVDRVEPDDVHTICMYEDNGCWFLAADPPFCYLNSPNGPGEPGHRGKGNCDWNGAVLYATDVIREGDELLADYEWGNER